MNCLTGNVFLNDFVLEKRAGNSGLDYINSPKFATCVLLEVLLKYQITSFKWQVNNHHASLNLYQEVFIQVIVFDYLRPAGIATEWDTSYWCHR